MSASRRRPPTARSRSIASSCMRKAAIAVGIAGLCLAALVLTLSAGHDVVALILVSVALVAALVAWLEQGPDSAKEVVLIGTLAGVAAAGRVLFTAVPGVQPVTVIVV